MQVAMALQLNAVAVRYRRRWSCLRGRQRQLLSGVKAVQQVGSTGQAPEPAGTRRPHGRWRPAGGPGRALHPGGEPSAEWPKVTQLGTLQMSIAGHDVTGAPAWSQHGNQFFNLALDMPCWLPADSGGCPSATWSLRLRPVCGHHRHHPRGRSGSALQRCVHPRRWSISVAAVQILQNRVRPANIVHILLGDNALGGPAWLRCTRRCPGYPAQSSAHQSGWMS